jgi:hypothetical protein
MTGGNAFSEITLRLDDSVRLIHTPGLAFRLQMSGSPSELYEVRVVLYGDRYTQEAYGVVGGGEAVTLFMDATEFSQWSEVQSIRLCTRRLQEGEGTYNLYVQSIAGCSNRYADAVLADRILAEMDAQDETAGPSFDWGRLLLVLLLASVFPITGMLFTWSQRQNAHDEENGFKGDDPD